MTYFPSIHHTAGNKLAALENKNETNAKNINIKSQNIISNLIIQNRDERYFDRQKLTDDRTLFVLASQLN